ncbi:MAG: efflux RND transporter periplasmic adaptor subunit [Candidatus Omnitrophota bacterium]
MNFSRKSKCVKYIWSFIAFVILAVVFVSYGSKEPVESAPISKESTEKEILFYTCGMHPSVKILPQDYNEDVLCPICNMKLIPVYKEETKADVPSEALTKEEAYYGCGFDAEGKCSHCDLGKPDARCICGEHSFVIEGQKMACPVCSKPLKKLSQGEIDKLKGVVSRVKIKGEQTRLAGVKTEPVKILHLYKEIRTVGRVAYDPELAIAQEEFISSHKALDKIQKGNIPEIKERAKNLVESAKRKLMLLGLSQEQIEELKDKREIYTSLILPEEKMWIYGEVYEYELSWVKEGAKVNVTTSSLPGEEFEGVISSVNPVLDPKTRSVRFRVQVDNPDLKLKPEMYVDIAIQSMYESPEGEHMVLAVSKDAVLDTGTRKIIWVDKGNEEYEGREVNIGPEATATIDGKESKFYPVLRGLSEGELVVTKANFLIDSQSQITGVAATSYGGALGAQEKTAPPAHQH